MSSKTYFIISMIAFAVSVIGLISFWGGVRSVNLGAFLFPLLIAALSFFKYAKEKKNGR